MLHVTELRRFPGHRSLAELIDQVDIVSDRLMRAFSALRRGCEGAIAEPIEKEWIRVPLDLQRTNMRSLQWLPIRILSW